MRNEVPQADVLITIVGTSAMPNLIGIVTRLKENSKVYFIHTKDTKIISDNLEAFIKKTNKMSEGKLNIKSELIAIENYDNPMEAYKEIYNKFSYIKGQIDNIRETDINIELNYTGGTKVMSSIACAVFKELFSQYNVFFTYLDGEKSKIFINSMKYIDKTIEEDYQMNNGILPLTVKDVIDIHKGYDNFFHCKKSEEEFVENKFSVDLFDYICKHNEKREDIINYLNELYLGLEKAGDSKDIILAFLDKFLAEHTLLDGYKNSRDILSSFNLNENKLSRKKIKSVKKSFRGIWMEDIVNKILYELKNENVIDDYICNVLRKEDSEDDFEIDFISMKNYKLYYFSVSTADDIEKTKFKLYEIKQRAKILSEGESAVATITFIESKKEIIDEYKNIWQDNPNNLLMITWNEMPRIKEIIKEWIMGRGANI